jgi:hypothetical protein
MKNCKEDVWIKGDIGLMCRWWPQKLGHREYMAVLPPRDSLRTPSYFSNEERGLLVGTNLFGVVDDREKELREEMEVVKRVVGQVTWYVLIMF